MKNPHRSLRPGRPTAALHIRIPKLRRRGTLRQLRGGGRHVRGDIDRVDEMQHPSPGPLRARGEEHAAQEDVEGDLGAHGCEHEGHGLDVVPFDGLVDLVWGEVGDVFAEAVVHGGAGHADCGDGGCLSWSSISLVGL